MWSQILRALAGRLPATVKLTHILHQWYVTLMNQWYMTLIDPYERD